MKKTYTLIEILVVMALAAVLTAMALPAFSALMHGNSAALTCSIIKGGLDQAQAHAVTDRKYAAAVFDLAGTVSGLTDTQALRICYVDSSYAFNGWIEGADWIPLDQNAQIMDIGLGGDGTSTAFLAGGVVDFSGKTGTLQSVSGVKGAGNTDGAALPGVVFSMYGNVKAPNGNFYIGVGEAKLANGVYICKDPDSSGKPTNVMALKVNHFTGRSLIAGIDGDGKIE